jgi:hypothetical protein
MYFTDHHHAYLFSNSISTYPRGSILSLTYVDEV